jgi:hypothetical protein
MALSDSIVSAESGGDPNARNPNSSASGAGQFIDSTWLDMVAKNRPDLMQGRSRDEVLALRNDPDLSRQMVQAYADQNAKSLSAAGLPVNDGTLYLAHFAGPAGAAKVLSADPRTPAASILGDTVTAANPFLRNMSAGDLAAWAQRKVGGNGGNNPQGNSAPQPSAAPATPQMGLLSGGGYPLGAPTAGASADTGASLPFSLAPQGPQQAPAPQAQPSQNPGQQPGQNQAAATPGALQPQAAMPSDTGATSALNLTAAAKARLFAALANRSGVPFGQMSSLSGS